MPPRLSAALAPLGTEPAAGPPAVGPGLLVVLAVLAAWLAWALTGFGEVANRHGLNVSRACPCVHSNGKGELE